MGRNVTKYIQWEEDGKWRAADPLFAGDFFWYEVDVSLKASEYVTDFGEVFLNGEGIGVALMVADFPKNSRFDPVVKKRS